MEGKPMPKIIEAIMVKNKVRNRLPAPMLIMEEVMTVPKLVKLTTPIIMPTSAQAAMTARDCLAPSTSASKISWKLMRVVFRHAATMMVKKMV